MKRCSTLLVAKEMQSITIIKITEGLELFYTTGWNVKW